MAAELRGYDYTKNARQEPSAARKAALPYARQQSVPLIFALYFQGDGDPLKSVRSDIRVAGSAVLPRGSPVLLDWKEIPTDPPATLRISNRYACDGCGALVSLQHNNIILLVTHVCFTIVRGQEQIKTARGLCNRSQSISIQLLQRTC